MREPAPRTAVTRKSAAELLARAPPSWRAILEKVGALVAKPGGHGADVLPSVDYDRVRYFARFWRTQTGAPPWMASALDGLEPYM